MMLYLLKNNIRKIRSEQGLTQTELAIKVGTTKNTISSYETNYYLPSARLSGLIAKALNKSWEDVFYFEVLEKEAIHEL